MELDGIAIDLLHIRVTREVRAPARTKHCPPPSVILGEGRESTSQAVTAGVETQPTTIPEPFHIDMAPCLHYGEPNAKECEPACQTRYTARIPPK